MYDVRWLGCCLLSCCGWSLCCPRRLCCIHSRCLVTHCTSCRHSHVPPSVDCFCLHYYLSPCCAPTLFAASLPPPPPALPHPSLTPSPPPQPPPLKPPRVQRLVWPPLHPPPPLPAALDMAAHRLPALSRACWRSTNCHPKSAHQSINSRSTATASNEVCGVQVLTHIVVCCCLRGAVRVPRADAHVRSEGGAAAVGRPGGVRIVRPLLPTSLTLNIQEGAAPLMGEAGTSSAAALK